MCLDATECLGWRGTFLWLDSYLALCVWKSPLLWELRREREWKMGIDWTWISPTAQSPPGQKVGTVSVKRWQRNLHNRHYCLHFVCRSVACCSQTAPLLCSDLAGCLRQQTTDFTILGNNNIKKKKKKTLIPMVTPVPNPAWLHEWEGATREIRETSKQQEVASIYTSSTHCL